MNRMFDWTEFIEQVAQSSLLEWLAVLTGVIYVILAARNSIYCWPFALVSSALYIYICYAFQLYLESGLQVFYFAMGIIGWLSWSNSQKQGGRIQQWSLTNHILNVVVSGLVALLLGYLFSLYSNQASPYIDAFTTCFSLTATFLVTKRVIGNWVYWIVIDLVSIYLYSSRGLHLSSVLYLLFTILAIAGFITWHKRFKLQQA